MKIARWIDLYETTETRRLKHLQWVPVPNKHDGLGFRKIASHPQATDILCAWILMLQIASRANPRGSLESNGTPLPPSDLQLITGFPKSIFEVAIPFLASIGWLELNGKSAGTPAESAGRREGNGREGKEGKEGNTSSSGDDVFILVEPQTPKPKAQSQAEAIYAAYPRKVGRPAALKAIIKALARDGGKVDLMERTKAFATACAGREQEFIPHPATWFKQERYNDDPSTWNPVAQPVKRQAPLPNIHIQANPDPAMRKAF